MKKSSVPGDDASRNMVRASVAALACASGAVVTAAYLAGREDRSPVILAANGGFAVAAAVFATAAADAALRMRGPHEPSAYASSSEGAETATTREALRTSIDRIAAIAQAGTIGDASAAEYAFAMIVRHATECSALLERG